MAPTAVGTSPAVLHVALNPVTGPWSVMRALASEQGNSGRYPGVGVGVITYGDWPEEYVQDLEEFSPYAYRSPTPKLFGTASFLLQRIMRPPIEGWITHLSRRTGARNVVLHFHNAWLSGVFVPVSVPGVKVVSVATFHGVAGGGMLKIQPLRRLLHRWMAQRLQRHGTLLTSVDTENLRHASQLFGLDGGLFHVIPNGLPVRSASPRRGPVLPDRLTVAHVGSLTPGKGWRIAVDAVLALSKEGLNINLILAGGGQDAEAARRLAVANPHCLTYLGYVRDPPANVLPGVDVAILMTDNDGLPMAILEALSSALPVISTRVGGIPTLIIDRRSGRLVDRNACALADVLRELYRAPSGLSELSAGAVEVFARAFNVSGIADRYDALYRQGLADSGSGTLRL